VAFIARITLARAVYSNSDIVMMDDPLAAVDSHVADHLFYQCIKGSLLSTKTRLLVTNQIHRLKDVDHVLYIEDGTIREQGSYDALVALNGTFCALIERLAVSSESASPANAKKAEVNHNGVDTAAPKAIEEELAVTPAPAVGTESALEQESKVK
jgi:ATP-binding cassette subfamily C (CFTR/MRP) protein 1